MQDVRTVAADDLDEIPGADTSVMESIAKLGDRLIVPLSLRRSVLHSRRGRAWG